MPLLTRVNEKKNSRYLDFEILSIRMLRMNNPLASVWTKIGVTFFKTLLLLKCTLNMEYSNNSH